MLAEYDIAACEWCRGDGRDHGTLGMATVRDCPRCTGSGRVYVTSRESTTGRRRVYKGPAPKPAVVVARQEQELTERVKVTKHKRKSKTKPKAHGRRHAA